MTVALPVAEESNDFWATAYPIIPHPGELIFGIIAIAILYWVVRTRVVPRLETIFAERTAAIEGGIAKAEQAQAAANEAQQRLEAELAEARAAHALEAAMAPDLTTLEQREPAYS